MIDFFNLEEIIASLTFVFFKPLFILESNTHPKEGRGEKKGEALAHLNLASRLLVLETISCSLEVSFMNSLQALSLQLLPWSLNICYTVAYKSS